MAGGGCLLPAIDGILKEICDPTIISFKDTIIKKKDELIKTGIPENKRTFQYCGGVILQELIIGKLQSIDLSKYGLAPEKIDQRLSYFKSEVFIDNFLSKLPVRDATKLSVLKTSYTEWFNKLFNVLYSDWRDEQLTKVDNQSQCRRGMGIAPGTVIADLQEIGNITCYLCGNLILPRATEQLPMECEHILPVLSALSHLWLIKAPVDRYTQEQLQILRLEYDWSHRCCNQIKSNYEFIKYDNTRYEYAINIPVITSVMSEIASSDKYDCTKIRPIDIPKQIISIGQRIKPLIEHINSILEQFDDESEYILLTKYKVLSALSSDDFLKALLGDGKIVEIPKTRAQIMKERKEAARIEALKEKEMLAQAAASRLAARAARADQRGAGKVPRVTGAATRAAASTPKQEYNDILNWEFTEEFLAKVSGLDNMTNIILQDPVFSPSPAEVDAKLNELFLTHTYTKFNAGYPGRTHTVFTNAPLRGNPQTGMFPPGVLGGTRKRRYRHRRKTIRR